MNPTTIDEQAHAKDLAAIRDLEDGRWLIAATQNMAAPDDEVPADAEHRPIFNSGS